MRRELEAAIRENRVVPVTNETGAYDEGNPNAEPPLSDVTILRKPPEKRTGHSATLVGRKIIIFGGSKNNTGGKTVYFNDMFELDTDPIPEIIVPKATSLSSFQTNLIRFKDSQAFSDVTFIVEGKVVHAHRLVLSLMSEHFRAMFMSGFKEKFQREILIPHISYQAFMLMLEFMYTGVPPDLSVYESESNLEAGSEAAGVFNTRKVTFSPNQSQPGAVIATAGEDFYDVDSDIDLFEGNFEDYDSDASATTLAASRRGSKALSLYSFSTTKRRMKALDGLKQIILAQTRKVEDLGRKVSWQKAQLVLEMLSVSDEYMLDSLKQTCEQHLQNIINAETVDLLRDAADKCNAEQLLESCLHFQRNYIEPVQTIDASKQEAQQLE